MENKTEKTKKFIKKNLKWIIVFLCLLYFIEITGDVYEKEIMTKDIIGYKIISSFMSDYITPIAKCITIFGSAITLILCSIILLVVIKNKKIGFSIFLNLGIIGMLNQILKMIIQRPRPSELRLTDVSGYSFPSGHTTNNTAFYILAIYFVCKNVKNTKKKRKGILKTPFRNPVKCL